MSDLQYRIRTLPIGDRPSGRWSNWQTYGASGFKVYGSQEVELRPLPPFTPGWFVHKDWVTSSGDLSTDSFPLLWCEEAHPGKNFRRVEVELSGD